MLLMIRRLSSNLMGAEPISVCSRNGEDDEMMKDSSFVAEMIFNSDVDSSMVRDGDCRLGSTAALMA
jgi:hypothetical protein